MKSKNKNEEIKGNNGKEEKTSTRIGIKQTRHRHTHTARETH